MKWFRRILRGSAATAVLFMFQACYGTPPAPQDDWSEEALSELEETALETAEVEETEDESAAVSALPE